MARLSKKAKKQFATYLLLLAFLILCCGIETCRAHGIIQQRDSVLNRAPILLSFRKTINVKTDGSNVYLQTNDHYVIMLDSNGKKVRQFFPGRFRYRLGASCSQISPAKKQGGLSAIGITDADALAVDRESGTLLFYLDGKCIQEFTKEGKLLHRYEGDSLEEFAALPRFANMQLESMFARDTCCTLDNGTVFAVQSCFLPMQWIARTSASKSRLLYLFPTFVIDQILYLYFMTVFAYVFFTPPEFFMDKKAKSEQAALENEPLEPTE